MVAENLWCDPEADRRVMGVQSRPMGLFNAKTRYSVNSSISWQLQKLRAQLADELAGQPFVNRARHGLFQIHVTVGKGHVRLLQMAKMTVRLVIGVGIICLQIQIIPFLELWIRRRSSTLEYVDLCGVSKERGVRRAENFICVHGFLAWPGEDIRIAAVTEDDVRSLELELRRVPRGRRAKPHVIAVQIRK